MYVILFSIFTLYTSYFLTLNLYILYTIYTVVFVSIFFFLKSYFYSINNINQTLIIHRFNKLSNFIFFFSSKVLFFFKNTPFYSQLKWQPLFKKSSYYGLYRSNKNQWLNK